jgi:hypothetical protein
MTIVPEEPELEVPVKKWRLPLTPLTPASGVLRTIDPVDVKLDAPVAREIDPPDPPEDIPACTVKCPPCPAVALEPCPPDQLTSPAL